MARLTFPDEGSRAVFRTAASGRPLTSAAGAAAVVYTDAAASILADITTTAGVAISGSSLSVDAYSRLPLFLGPADGTDTLYVVVDGGPVSPMYARADDRIDAVSAQVTSTAADLATEQTRALAAESALTTAVVARQTLSQKGQANGYAGLDSGGTVPDTQIPAGIARDTEVTAAVAALVNSAPGTLDTLGELATALQADEGTAAALATLVGTKSQGLVPTALKTGAYTAAAADLVLVDTTSAGVTVTLPTAPADKTRVAVKHVVQGGTNAVTIAAGGTDRFNTSTGPTTATLPLLNQAVQVQYAAGSPGRWIVSADDIPLSQLDLRYLTPTTANGTYAKGGGLSLVITGPTLVRADGTALPTGTEYVWNKTDGAGTLLDIVSGVAA